MKRAIIICSVFLLISVISSCKKDKDEQDPNVIEGDTNTTLGQVGNVFTPSTVRVGSNYYPAVQPLTITKNDNGEVTVRLVADLSTIPGMSALNNYIPASMKDTQGRLNTDVKFKVTSEGIQDTFNPDKYYHTMVKYDCSVGDQYNLTGSDNKTVTRTVTAKSTDDDFPFGLMYIKATTVEQTSPRIPGIRKIIYKANHKFGLVYMEVVPEAGSSGSMYVYPTNY
jgi:hypothetical protein